MKTSHPPHEAARVLRVAIDVPVRRLFDYLPPAELPRHAVVPGMRVQVPFGRSQRVGVLISVAAHSDIPSAKMKRARAVLDTEPLWSPAMFSVIEWAASYYHHPVGEVFAAAMPGTLRRFHSTRANTEEVYAITAAGRLGISQLTGRAPRQEQLLRWLFTTEGQVSAADLEWALPGWRTAMRALQRRGFAQSAAKIIAPPPAPASSLLALNAAQQAALAAICARLDGFAAFLLDGVTGSGKTEVYLRVIAEHIGRGRQALVLVPEISLTAQTVARFQERFGARLAVLHSALTDTERTQASERARRGEAAIVIGTRSAVWVPLVRPGVIIADEEHDLSYKQQEGFRYSARDVAVMRAQREGVPIVLGSATPALESLANVASGRYQPLYLSERSGVSRLPALRLLDMRNRALQAGLCGPMFAAIEETLARGEQVLVFLNRRGYAPVLICHVCGQVTSCRRCDARMTVHRGSAEMLCHHCGARRAVPEACTACGSAELLMLGQGTERLAEMLGQRFGTHKVVRIDRDATRRKGSLDAALTSARLGSASILVGTQMLAKGHHFPGVTLVIVVDADSQLYSVNLRAGERLAQLIVQVAGRAGRGERPGQVVVQTHHPEHPLFNTLLREGYAGVSAALLEERKAAGLPPFAHLAVVRAEAATAPPPMQFLRELAAFAAARRSRSLEVLGPLPAPMARRAGRHRAQLLLRSTRRAELHALLDALAPHAETLPRARRVRWSLDVDPMELF